MRSFVVVVRIPSVRPPAFLIRLDCTHCFALTVRRDSFRTPSMLSFLLYPYCARILPHIASPIHASPHSWSPYCQLSPYFLFVFAPFLFPPSSSSFTKPLLPCRKISCSTTVRTYLPCENGIFHHKLISPCKYLVHHHIIRVAIVFIRCLCTHCAPPPNMRPANTTPHRN